MVIKFGGSLVNEAKEILKIIKPYCPVIVPGGGHFADYIRKIDIKMDLSDEAAHRMAIFATQQYGVYLSDISGIECSNSTEDGPIILMPYDLLCKYEPFEYSWEVTSDCIACFIAKLYGYKSFVLLKRVDGIYVDGVLRKELNIPLVKQIDQSVVDSRLANYMCQYGIDCYIYNASDIEVFRRNFKKGNYGTKICCK